MKKDLNYQEELIQEVQMMAFELAELENNKSIAEAFALELELKNLDFDSRTALDKQKIQLMVKDEAYRVVSNKIDEISRRINKVNTIKRFLENFIYSTFSADLYERVYHNLKEYQRMEETEDADNKK